MHITTHHQFSSVAQSCPTVTPWTVACQASLFIINSQSLLKLMCIELVMPSNHLILCHPLLLLPSIFPSIRVFSNEWVLRIRQPKDWSFSFSIVLPRASLVAQSVKNLPAMQETQVRFLGWEDPQRRKWQTTPVFLPGESHGQKILARVVHDLMTKSLPVNIQDWFPLGLNTSWENAVEDGHSPSIYLCFMFWKENLCFNSYNAR